MNQPPTSSRTSHLPLAGHQMLLGINLVREYLSYPTGQASTARRVLSIVDFTFNDFGTNTLPYSIKCADVCEVMLIVVEFDATVLCDKKRSKHWNCGLDHLKEELMPYFPRTATGQYVSKYDKALR